MIGELNNVGVEGGKSIGNGLSGLKNLRALDMTIWNDNNLKAEGWVGLSDGVRFLKNLESLNLKIRRDNDFEI